MVLENSGKRTQKGPGKSWKNTFTCESHFEKKGKRKEAKWNAMMQNTRLGEEGNISV